MTAAAIQKAYEKFIEIEEKRTAQGQRNYDRTDLNFEFSKEQLLSFALLPCHTVALAKAGAHQQRQHL